MKYYIVSLDILRKIAQTHHEVALQMLANGKDHHMIPALTDGVMKLLVENGDLIETTKPGEDK